MKKCIILSRVSTAQQQLTDQTNDLLKEAKRLGYSKNNIIVIEDIESATKLSEEERQGLNKLKNNINSDSSIDCVICWEPSRISRQQKILYSIRDFLVEKKVQLIILNPYVRLLDSKGNIDSTASIVFSLFSTLAENEMMIKKDRFMRAKTAMIQQGKLANGKPLFGYTKDKNSYLVEHPIEADVVRYIFNTYSKGGISLRVLYNDLVQKGMMKETKMINGCNKIKRIIENKIYSGRTNHKNVYKTKMKYTGFISPELQDKAIEMLSQNKSEPKSKTKYIYYGKKIVRCGCCGHAMTAYISGHMYRCLTNQLGQVEEKHINYLNMDVIDTILWENAKEFANIDSGLNDTKMIVEYNDKIKENKKAIENINKILNNLEDKERKAFNIYLNGKINENIFDEQIAIINKDRDNWKKELAMKHQQIFEYEDILKGSSTFKQSIHNVDSIVDDNARSEIIHKYIESCICTRLPDAKKGTAKTKIEIIPKSGTIVPQHEYYIYYTIGGKKYLERHNEDGTIDDISKTIFSHIPYKVKR